MPKPQLYHCVNARSFRVLWTMCEMGWKAREDFELYTMPFPPRVFQKHFLKLNPLGTIPFFTDGPSVRMTESVVIPLYLVSKYGPQSLAISPHESNYSEFLNWLGHADATLTFPQTVVLRYTQQEPGRADNAAVDYGKWYIARLRLLDQVLSDGREFLCHRFTIADIGIAYALFLGTTLGLDGKYQPQTRAYLERMMQRPSFLAAQQMQDDPACATMGLPSSL